MLFKRGIALLLLLSLAVFAEDKAKKSRAMKTIQLAYRIRLTLPAIIAMLIRMALKQNFLVETPLRVS